MVISKLLRRALLWAALCYPVAAQNHVQVSEVQARQQLDHAIRAHLEAWYQDNRIDLCWGSAGLRFDLEDETILLHGETATVSYTLVEFESCEEGAAYDKDRRTESWIRKAEGWERAETGRAIPAARTSSGVYFPVWDCLQNVGSCVLFF
jgi:hypothetical protein